MRSLRDLLIKELFVSPRTLITLRAGPYFVLRKIIAEYRLDEMLGDIIGKNSGLFLDLAVN